MPILELQKRMAEKGRIRMGEKVAMSNSSNKRPAKLETFKFTSIDEVVIKEAAALYGGEVKAFEKTQFGVVTEAPAINVVLVPADMGFSQWREMWGNKVCYRRCDGNRETISDGACQCPEDPAERSALASKGKACKDTTRLSVMLPDLPGVGLWRLESHGYYAATELAGTIEVLSRLAPRTLVRGRLIAEPRSVVRFDRDGKPQTQNFIVPVLDLPDVRLSQLMAPTGDGVSVQIEAGNAPGLTPVPVAELPAGPQPSIREQIAAVPDQKPRSNAAAEIPSTGLEPPGMTNPDDQPLSVVNPQAYKNRVAKAHALGSELGLDHDALHDLLGCSFTEASVDQMTALIVGLQERAEVGERVERGDVEVVTPQASGGGRSAETPPASGDDLAGSAAVPAAPSAASSGDTDLAALVAAVKGYSDGRVNGRVAAICRDLPGDVKPVDWHALTPDHLAYVPLVDWLEGLRTEQEATT